jgi:hypothetical protein
VFCLTAHTLAFADALVSPGKTTAYASASGVSFGPTPAAVPAVAVQILKGKKKRALEIDLTAIVPSVAAEQTIQVRPLVNGLAIEPLGGIQAEHGCDTGVINCTAQGTFWLDLDTAEATNPGVFANQPLNVETEVLTGSVTSGSVSVRARMVKK